jgi:hypothetical protein
MSPIIHECQQIWKLWPSSRLTGSKERQIDMRPSPVRMLDLRSMQPPTLTHPCCELSASSCSMFRVTYMMVYPNPLVFLAEGFRRSTPDPVLFCSDRSRYFRLQNCMPSTTPFPGYNANQRARAATDAEQPRLQSSTTQIAPSATVRHPQAELGCVPIRQRIQLRM